MSRLALLLLPTLLAAGCEVLFGIKESDTSSGAGASTSTASSSATASSSGRATTSAGSAGSSGAPVDGGSDAPFCASQAPGYSFCADFDEGTILGADAGPTRGWTNPDQTSGASVGFELDSTVSLSAPGSLEAMSVVGPENPAGQSARLIKTLGDPSAVHVDFDLLPCDATASAGASVALLAIDCEPNAGPAQFGVIDFGIYPSGYELHISGYDDAAEAGVPHATIPLPSLPGSGWTHVHVDVAFGGAGPVTYRIGDAGSFTSDAGTACPGTMHQRALAMGMLAYGATPACVVHFDNVLVTTDP